MTHVVELRSDECAVLGAMLDHISAHSGNRRIRLRVNDDGVAVAVGDHPFTAALGTRIEQ